MLTVYMLAQIDPNADPPTSVLAAVIWLGSVIVVGLLFALRTLWKDNQALRSNADSLSEKYQKAQEETLRSSLQVTIDASNRIKESEQSVEEAMKTIETVSVMVHQMAGQRFPVELMTEISFHLKALREMKSGN